MAQKTCPRCGTMAANDNQIAQLFGYRKRNAGLRPQSYCIMCRNHPQVSVPAPTPEVVKPDREQLKVMYEMEYPNDKCKTRSYNFMHQRLVRRSARLRNAGS